MGPTEVLRLRCPLFTVTVRVRDFGAGRVLAWAETPDGPSLGTGATRSEAIAAALEVYRDVREALLASLEDEAP